MTAKEQWLEAARQQLDRNDQATRNGGAAMTPWIYTRIKAAGASKWVRHTQYGTAWVTRYDDKPNVCRFGIPGVGRGIARLTPRECRRFVEACYAEEQP